MQKFDLLIVGAGMVGLTFALAIRKTTTLTVALVDKTPLLTTDEAPSVRVSAINMASQQIFEQLDVWSSITEQRLQPYNQMHVWDKAGYGKLSFSNKDISGVNNLEQLGWIIENTVVRKALWNKAQQDSGITFFTEEAITNIGLGESEVFASFTTQMPITAKLVVGADGANSWVRKQMEMPLTFRDYDHNAIVATVKCSQDHQNTAWQVFLPTGPLALLPLFDKNLCSIVWSTSPEDAARLMALSPESFSKALTAATDGKLGNILLESETFSYPLSMRLSQKFTQDKVVLVGDAAHTIHPLAGQGVNLGLLDAASLAQVISDQINKENSTENNTENTQNISWTSSPVLNQYARWRKAEAAEMVAAMETIKQVFTPQNPFTQIVRGVGMNLFDNITPIKQLVAKQALGFKSNLPFLAKATSG